MAGPDGVGKTLFVEHLLRAEIGVSLCVRGRRDPRLREARVMAPRNNAELRRYSEAGGAAMAYGFREPDTNAFFSTEPMQDYSEVVLIEGDCPTELIDCRVYVAPVLPPGRSLLRRVAGVRKWQREHLALRELRQSLGGEGALARTFGMLGAAVDRELVRQQSDGGHRRGRTPSLESWVLDDGYAGIERAQVVIVNVRSEDERDTAAALIGDVARIRKDKEVFADVVPIGTYRHPVTAVVADLSDARDVGVKKARGRVKRAVKAARA
ncbi:MAG TPA: hypothetical protein VFZ65_04580 [Planctomycetota bacterium]|nr:hypothetical protein [Planctomycetota bacterium]